MNNYPVRLSLIDKARIAYTRVDAAEFIGILATYLRDKVPVNNNFYIVGVDDFSFDFYGESGGEEYISNGPKRIPLAKSRSFATSLMNRFSNNEFVKEYQEMKKAITEPE
jgi:hypothetical protein